MAVQNPADDRADPGAEVWAWLERHYLEERSQLYHFALGVLGNREDAEDATQIALLNAHRALARGERPSRPRAWLFAIALNVCRRLLRARARRTVVAAGEFHSAERDADGPTGAEISLAVASLPRGQREIFLLRELQGLSYAELSQRLGLSAAAAESLLARARRGLRKQLAVPGEGRRPLLALPGIVGGLRIVRGPAALKLAGIVGAAAIAPSVVIGLQAGPERSPKPVLPTAPRAVVQHATRSFVPTRTRPARREPAEPAVMAPASARRATRAAPVSADAPRTATHKPPPAAPEGLQATPEQPPAAVGTVQVAVKAPLAPAVKRPETVSPPAAEPLDPSGLATVPETSAPDVADGALATVQDAVDELPPVSLAPEVPSPPALDPVQDSIPDPLPASSTKKTSSAGK